MIRRFDRPASPRSGGPPIGPAPALARLTGSGHALLLRLEETGPATLRHLIRDLEWCPDLVVEAIAQLVDAGLARATRDALDLLIQPVQTRSRHPSLQVRQRPSGLYR